MNQQQHNIVRFSADITSHLLDEPNIAFHCVELKIATQTWGNSRQELSTFTMYVDHRNVGCIDRLIDDLVEARAQLHARLSTAV